MAFTFDITYADDATRDHVWKMVSMRLDRKEQEARAAIADFPAKFAKNQQYLADDDRLVDAGLWLQETSRFRTIVGQGSGSAGLVDAVKDVLDRLVAGSIHPPISSSAMAGVVARRRLAVLASLLEML
jgi:hypothetical protein